MSTLYLVRWDGKTMWAYPVLAEAEAYAAHLRASHPDVPKTITVEVATQAEAFAWAEERADAQAHHVAPLGAEEYDGGVAVTLRVWYSPAMVRAAGGTPQACLYDAVGHAQAWRDSAERDADEDDRHQPVTP
jgi:hypothetical protein